MLNGRQLLHKTFPRNSCSYHRCIDCHFRAICWMKSNMLWGRFLRSRYLYFVWRHAAIIFTPVLVFCLGSVLYSHTFLVLLTTEKDRNLLDPTNINIYWLRSATALSVQCVHQIFFKNVFSLLAYPYWLRLFLIKVIVLSLSPYVTQYRKKRDALSVGTLSGWSC